VAGSFEYGDKPLGSYTVEFVRRIHFLRAKESYSL
jgi:hypothetical protein